MTEKNTIEKQVELKAPVERVWRALADHKQFGEWFKVIIDAPFEPGKVSTGRMNFPGYEHIKWKVQIKEMVENKTFSFTWHPYAMDPAVDYEQEEPTLVEFELEKIDGGTLMKVSESGFDKIPKHRMAEAFPMNEHGWEMQMNNVSEYVSKAEQPSSR